LAQEFLTIQGEKGGRGKVKSLARCQKRCVSVPWNGKGRKERETSVPKEKLTTEKIQFHRMGGEAKKTTLKGERQRP